MKYNYIKDDFFYHINAVLNNGNKFYQSCTKDEMIEFIVNHRRVSKTQFRNDAELIKAYLAVKERFPDSPKRIEAKSSYNPDGKFLFLLLRNDLWEAIEKNIPKNQWMSFFESAVEQKLQDNGYY